MNANAQISSSLHSLFNKPTKTSPKLIRLSTPLTNTPNLSPTTTPRKSESSFSNTNPKPPKPKKDPNITHLNTIKRSTNESKPTVTKPSSGHEKQNSDDILIKQEHQNKENIEFQLSNLQTLQQHIYSVTNCVDSILFTNFSQIIYDTNLKIENNSMYKQFKTFHKCAHSYFNNLLKILNQNVEERKRNSFPVSDLKTHAFSFCNKWDEMVRIYKILQENGLPSLAEYISIRFKSIHHSIIEITTNNRRDTVHADTLLATGGKLRHLLYGLNRSIQEMFLYSSLKNLDDSLMQMHLTSIKSFIQVYNEVHFREFPKSGCNSVELSQYKSSVFAVFNDIMKAIKAGFSLKTSMEELLNESDEVQKCLTILVSSLNLPQVVVRTVAKTTPLESDEIDVDPFEKIKQFVGGYEVSIVICSKLELFIENIQMKLEIPFDDPSLNVWDRLKKLEKAFIQKIELVNESEKDIQSLKKELAKQNEEMEEVLKQTQDKNAEISTIQKQLNKELNDLQEKYDNEMKEKNELKETIKKKNRLIKEIRDGQCGQKNKEMLNRVGTKMAQLMTSNEDDFDIPKNEEDVLSVDKMSVFVVEKRCQKCREFKLLRKQAKDLLRDIVDVAKGETIHSVIQRLSNEVKHLREEHDKLVKENDQLTDEKNKLIEEKDQLIKQNEEAKSQIQQLKDLLLKVLRQSHQFEHCSIEGKTISEISDMLDIALNDLKKENQEKLQKKEEQLRDQHNKELLEITKELTAANQLREMEKKKHEALLQEAIRAKESMIKEIQKMNEQLLELKKELNIKNDIIKNVQGWMIRMSEFPSSSEMPVERSLETMMNLIENKPNPLKKIYEKAKKKLEQIGGKLYLLTKRVDHFQNEVTPDLSKSDPIEVLQYLTFNLDKLIQLFEKMKAEDELLRTDNQLAEMNLRSICRRVAQLLEYEDVDIDNKTISQIIFLIQSYIDDLGNLEENKQFLRIGFVNKLTKQLRNLCGIQSLDPKTYFPLITQTVSKSNVSLSELKKFDAPLSDIFQSCDFKTENSSLDSEGFTIVREKLFQIHVIMRNMPFEDMDESVANIIKHFVLMPSYFLSTLASVNMSIFENPPS